jgi:hypothetical protein
MQTAVFGKKLQKKISEWPFTIYSIQKITFHKPKKTSAGQSATAATGETLASINAGFAVVC